MCAALSIQLNGQPRSFSHLEGSTALVEVLEALALKQDRIAVEHNGTIVPRSAWQQIRIAQGDRLEIVHFVGGGHERPIAEWKQSSSPVRE